MKIGKIPYANLFPIFYVLEKEYSSYEFIEGVPSELNRMIRDGLLDVCPSSSIEYILRPSHYRLIDGHSVSSKGPVMSILLFSRYPLENLNGKRICYSYQSETSVALLRIILKKFYRFKFTLEISKEPEDSDYDAFLLIGDDALKGASKSKFQVSWYIYDLGQIWFEQTGLPFVFALWIARKEVQEKALNRFVKDLDSAKEIALKNLRDIAKYSNLKKFMSEEEILSYWNLIDYDLKEEHKKGLHLFDSYLKEIGYDI